MDDEALARMAANILGPSTGAAKALAALDRRRSAGEDVVIFERDKTWWVGPRPSIPQPRGAAKERP